MKTCQNCGRNPAQISYKSVKNGKSTKTDLCFSCAENLNLFNMDNSFGSMFDSFFDSNVGNPDMLNSFASKLGGNTGAQVNILDYFSDRAKNVLDQAVEFSSVKMAKNVDTEHLLAALLNSQDPIVLKIFDKLDIKLSDISGYIDANINEEGQSSTGNFSPKVKNTLILAYKIAKQAGLNYVGPEHILLALSKEKEGLASIILKKFGIETKKLEQILNKINNNGIKNSVSSETPTLDEFSIDLTEKASNGQIDPVIGREKEIARVIQILTRRTKNNPVLIGEPGVGKTAIAEGLALKIYQKKVPELLHGKRVLSLNLTALVAGTKYRGDFEERIKKLIDEVKEVSDEVILFIDEIHTVIGVGASEGQLDVANILKPALARGEFTSIGATTLNEYQKYIEKDAALERRFQPVQVNEPTVDEAVLILRGLKDKFEAHHKVEISDAAVIAAVTLSNKYLTDRFLPDKAIDLIDEAAAKVHLQILSQPAELKELEQKLKNAEKEKESAVSIQDFKTASMLKAEIDELNLKINNLKELNLTTKSKSNAEVTDEDIKEIISEWSGVPLKQMNQTEINKLLELESTLGTKVIGQANAVKLVSEAIRRNKVGLSDPKRPIGSFLLLGPTGVGKTELTKVLTEELFGTKDAMIRLDMSEYMEKHAVSKIIGSPPGYVGFDEGGQLTEKVRRKPYAVILLDEIEKAHPDVFNLLLQVLEDGHLTDSKGRKVNFKNTIIIATSNIGSKYIQEGSEDLQQKIKLELKNNFRPEFINRLDEIIIFESLKEPELKKILSLILDDLQLRLIAQGIKLEVSEKAQNFLLKEGYDKEFGARPMKRIVQRLLENPIANLILSAKVNSGNTIKIEFAKDKLQFKTVK